jgi:hypothetical protein
MTTSTDNPELDKKMIIENFMEELGETTRITKAPVEDIRQKHLRTFEIE